MYEMSFIEGCSVMGRISKSGGRRFYRRKARWPGVIAVCVLICFCIVLAGPVFHVWDRLFPPAAIQAGAIAAGYENIAEEGATYYRSIRQEPDLQEVTEKLISLLESQFESGVSAEGIVILDEAGNSLYEMNADVQRAPASMTKLMTAIVAIEAGTLEDTVTVGELYGCYVEDSVLIYLEAGEQVAMRDLLAAIMIKSANDAAAAIAIHVAGSIEAFAQMMNDKAAEMGLENTHFANPHGLTEEGHYTTPRDMAKILQRASEYEILQELSKTAEYTFSSTSTYGENYSYTLNSLNDFALGTMQVEPFTYVCGKTGYTSAAGRCLAAAFRKDTGEMYYCVVMRSEENFEDMCQTLNFLGRRLEALA